MTTNDTAARLLANAEARLARAARGDVAGYWEAVRRYEAALAAVEVAR